MEELVIRPTTKFIRIGYVVVILLLLASVIVENLFKDSLSPNLPLWLIPGLFALLLLWPASRHWTQRFTKMTMVGDKLRYETGILSKATRTIQLSKVQDVTVRQSVAVAVRVAVRTVVTPAPPALVSCQPNATGSPAFTLVNSVASPASAP